MAKILVIEDDAIIREEVLDWLQYDGYEGVGAANGQIGIETALQALPDLIISDVMMPIKDGYRVLAELRAHPTTALIPFIFLTARGGRSQIRYGMELGADDYIEKPFSGQELLAAVRTQLARRAAFAQDAEKKLHNLRHNLARTLPHELRTPLVGILGIGELLSYNPEALTPQDLVEFSEMILRNGERLYRLIENHLLYVQLELRAAAPDVGWNASPIDQISEVLHTMLAQRAETYARLADLSAQFAPGTLHISDDDLTKILYEVVDNAFKFSKAGSPVRVIGQVQPSVYVISVADQGRGMSAENIAQIGPYTQFDRERYEQQGMGLGLVIAKRLIEMYSGVLQIESALDAGTTVYLTFPAD